MLPEQKSTTLLRITRAKAKMHEYGVPPLYHIQLPTDPVRLMSLAIGMLGDYAAQLAEVPLTQRLPDPDRGLNFSASYFEAYYQARLLTDVEPYLILLGAASYYLCNLPGSAAVLSRQLLPNAEMEAEGLEQVLVFLLQSPTEPVSLGEISRFRENSQRVVTAVAAYRQSGTGMQAVVELVNTLRRQVYADGSPRQLLFVDVIAALIRVLYENSCWRCLPEYSGLTREAWESTIQKTSFVKELWPAQQLLGRQGIFSGKSAVIQMPTSAGKTRATEMIIRSAFLAGRTEIAIIVAPFKALCHEISDALAKSFAGEAISVEELSEVIQDDIELFVSEVKQQIFIVTPEKLIYLLKQSPQFADGVGLLIYDEGHQFDTGARGVTFELLLTTLKAIVFQPQTVLLSAVLSNAGPISEWLTPQGGEVVAGLSIAPNFRSVAFASWTTLLGQLHFVNEQDPASTEFFVPRVIEAVALKRGKRARRDRYFPDKGEPNSISLYLGLKLVANGGVALFCGTKATAVALCRTLVEAYNLDLPLPSPATYSNPAEVQRLVALHERNLGTSEDCTLAARLGVFSHHNNIPTGIRLAVEYAMREDLVKFVLCTSTLAQGVNLPIRYLIVTGLQQGAENIKTRDFHNLMGRAGRSGMHTEGSIIFGNPEVFDNKNLRAENWRWRQAIDLFQPSHNEPCNSYLLTILEGFYNPRTKTIIPGFDALAFCEQYIQGVALVAVIPEAVATSPQELASIRAAIEEQVRSKLHILASIESYLMSYGTEPKPPAVSGVAELASSTLAYHLANGANKQKILQLFDLLETNIRRETPTYARRRVLGKTLFGLQKSLELEHWLKRHMQPLTACFQTGEVWDLVWPVVAQNITSRIFINLENREFIRVLARFWLTGRPFHMLRQLLQENQVTYRWGTSTRPITIEQTVDLCQNALAYEGALVLGALASILAYLTSDQNPTVGLLRRLQKGLQYGLPTQAAIGLYELGFADRPVALELGTLMGAADSRADLLTHLKENTATYREALAKYPRYFSQTLHDCLAKST